jgi:hypothetical protein
MPRERLPEILAWIRARANPGSELSPAFYACRLQPDARARTGYARRLRKRGTHLDRQVAVRIRSRARFLPPLLACGQVTGRESDRTG